MVENQQLIVEYPTSLLDELSPTQLQHLAREAFYVRLYDQGLISSGNAGSMLGISRGEFLDLLGKYGVSYFDSTTDVIADADRAHESRS